MNKLNMLIAYPYMSNEVVKYLSDYSDDFCFVLDSGAFTAWKANKPIKLDDYCSFIEKLPFKPFMYFMLDVIGDPHATMKNYETMLKRGFNPVPIFTRGEDLSVLEDYYKTSEIVGIGGLVGTPGNKGFVKALMNKIGNRKVHWLGFTNKDFVYTYRPFSCDSSSLVMACKFGQTEVFNRETFEWKKIKRTDDKKKILSFQKILRSYDIEPLSMIKNDNWRWIKRKNLSADLSFMSHIRASLCYEMKFKTKYFLAAVACDGEHYIKMAHNLFLKERNKLIGDLKI